MSLNFVEGRPLAFVKGGKYSGKIVHLGDKKQKIEDPYEYIEEDEIRSRRQNLYKQYQDYLDSVDAASKTSAADESQTGTMKGRTFKQLSAEDSLLIGRLFAQHLNFLR